MKCTNCGKEIDNDSVFCEFCGAKVNKASNNSTPPSSIQTRPATPTTSNQQKQPPKAVAALVLGICSIVFGCYVGIILGIIGLVLSKKGYAAYNEAPEQYAGDGMLKAGKITSIIGIIIGIIYILYFVILYIYMGYSFLELH